MKEERNRSSWTEDRPAAGGRKTRCASATRGEFALGSSCTIYKIQNIQESAWASATSGKQPGDPVHGSVEPQHAQVGRAEQTVGSALPPFSTALSALPCRQSKARLVEGSLGARCKRELTLVEVVAGADDEVGRHAVRDGAHHRRHIALIVQPLPSPVCGTIVSFSGSDMMFWD